MRTVQALAWGVFAALLVVCGAWAFVWFGMSSPSTDTIQATPAPKSVTVTTIRLNSDPQGADARTSLGWSCRTPCSMELSVDGPFTVTFTPGCSLPDQRASAVAAGSKCFSPAPMPRRRIQARAYSAQRQRVGSLDLLASSRRVDYHEFVNQSSASASRICAVYPELGSLRGTSPPSGLLATAATPVPSASGLWLL
jgi:hypothetical protein